MNSNAMLTPCPTCRRHVSASDEACPFCGALVAHLTRAFVPRASRAQMVMVAAAFAVTGCEEKPRPEVTNVATEKSAPSTAPSAAASAPVVASAEPLVSAIPSLGSYDVSGLSGMGMGAAYGAPPSPGLGESNLKGDVATSPATGNVVALKDPDTVIAAARPRFRSCYSRTLNQDPLAGGKVTLALTVGTSGDVTSATVASSTAPQLLSACVASVARGLKFTAPTKPASIQVPLIFTSKS